MNARLLTTLFAGVLLAGFAGAAWSQNKNCETLETKDEECQGDRRFPIVTINTETGEIHPEFVCAERDRIIEFRVVPPGKTDSGAIAVKAKDESNTWLIGTNFPSKMRIEVVVPIWIQRDTIHAYNIIFANGKCVDPRIHVED